jgi:hypothetical protein
MKSWRAMRAISSNSACSGLAAMEPSVAMRLAHEARRVDDLDGLLRGHAGSDELAAAAEAQHQVLLNEAEGDVQVGGHEALVDVDRRAAAGSAQVAMLGERLGVVADDAVLCRNLRADDGVDLVRRGAAMQAGSDEDGDALDRDAGLVQPLQHRRQRDAVGRGRVMSQTLMAAVFLPAGQLQQRLGADGGIERRIERGALIGERLSRVAHDDLRFITLWDGNVHPCLAKRKMHFHALPRFCPEPNSSTISEGKFTAFEISSL